VRHKRRARCRTLAKVGDVATVSTHINSIAYMYTHAHTPITRHARTHARNVVTRTRTQQRFHLSPILLPYSCAMRSHKRTSSTHQVTAHSQHHIAYRALCTMSICDGVSSRAGLLR
jgi:hypothetical protein